MTAFTRVEIAVPTLQLKDFGTVKYCVANVLSEVLTDG
jgi:hypothetical protein